MAEVLNAKKRLKKEEESKRAVQEISKKRDEEIKKLKSELDSMQVKQQEEEAGR